MMSRVAERRDVGFTIAAGGPTYWVGEAMGSVNFIISTRFPKPPQTNRMARPQSATLRAC